MASSNSQRRIEQVHADLRDKPRTWLVTGAAGFIGSHLVENLLQLGQTVTGMDDYSTGQPRNLAEVQALVTPAQWARFEFIEGDIRDLAMCTRACARKEFVLHHAALGSVPLSIADPLRTHTVNVQGTLHILQAARDCGVRRVVYASSSAVYGDQPGESMREDLLGRPLSPYAASKWMNEIDAEVFGRCYALSTVGLRYFNVFGPRQDPNGAYAAVIPRWIQALLENKPVEIFGDGETTRDFCHVENVVQANLLAATTPLETSSGVFNIACGERSSLNALFRLIQDSLMPVDSNLAKRKPEHHACRPGDVRHSRADITRAREMLGYSPTHEVTRGLEEARDWYVRDLRRRQAE